jgi:hypothetical protein
MNKNFDKSKYLYSRNMNDEPIYRTKLINKFINCEKCNNELDRDSGLKYSIINGKKCGHWNDD